MPSLLQVSNLSLAVGANELVDGVSTRVVDGQRVALIGPNGCGKSTLLRALRQASDQPLSEHYYTVVSGSIELGTPADSILHVEQDDLQWSELLPTAECSEDGIREMMLPDALDLAAATGDEAAVEDAEMWRRLSVAADKSLGWHTAGYDRTPIGKLSPGCAARAYLAVALHRPGMKLLLLDEPTNHLDIPSVIWLQQVILASAKALVLVSHDAHFLEVVADHLWDVDPIRRSVTVTGAKFEAFRHAKELAREQQRAAHEAHSERHKRLTAAADKLRDASAAGARFETKDRAKLQRNFKRDRAGRSGGKAKAIEALRDSVVAIERGVERAPLRIQLDTPGSGHDSHIMLGEAVLGYAQTGPLPLPPVTLRVDFGERVAIVGANGVGKSTLLRVLAGSLTTLRGTAHVGRELRVGNLTQEHESLPFGQTPRQHLAALAGLPPFDAGQRLIRYGLTLQQVDRAIGELNPGARARTLLATFAYAKANALILDEPSNHLDGEALSEVMGTLNEYEGTVIAVSHNLDFLRSVRFTRTLCLDHDGLREVESLDEYVRFTAETVRSVLQAAGLPATPL
jgi:ATPase subunit of ABC transporter with duplicated ATPase domains